MQILHNLIYANATMVEVFWSKCKGNLWNHPIRALTNDGAHLRGHGFPSQQVLIGLGPQYEL